MHVSSLVPHTCDVNQVPTKRVNDVYTMPISMSLSIPPLQLNLQLPPFLPHSLVHHFFTAGSADLHSAG